MYYSISKGNTFSSNQPYMFVRQLISNSCVYKNDDRNHNRYLAVYFDKNRAHVPPYLTPRAYFLPLQFSSFIQNIFGIQTHFSYLYNKIFEQNVPQLAERKQQLHDLAECLNDSQHKSCFSSTCHKVTDFSSNIFHRTYLTNMDEFNGRLPFTRNVFSAISFYLLEFNTNLRYYHSRVH